MGVVINCSVGESGDKILKAIKVLKDLTGQEPVTSKCKYTIRSFGVRRGDKIACHVTVRGEKATEHIDLGIRYDPYTGIFGMDFYVVLKKPGFRVSRRKRCRSKVGNSQKISADEARDWFKSTYDGLLI